MTFHVGQKVVCIRVDGLYSEPILTIGGIYTVERVGGLAGEMIDVMESPHKGAVFGAYYVDRFRPVKNTSIEVFRKMLAPTPVKENV